jgi:ribosomal protein S18 acetylase RimI-like enzyme
MKIFIAGIMQGSLPGNHIHSQDYRAQLKAILRRDYPQAAVVCPWEIFPDSVEYGPDKARETLLALMEEASRCDVVIAYVPEASMGTALEMWKAFEAGRAVLSISPLRYNWVVQCLSREVFASIEDFERFSAAGGLNVFDRPEIRIERGLPEALRTPATHLYYEAFSAKMTPIMDEESALAVFPGMINADQAIIALRDGEIVGMANLESDAGPAFHLRLSEFRRAFGLLKGFYRYLLFKFLTDAAPAGEVLVESLCVAAKARGQGVGTLLLEAVFAHARQHGYPTVRLEVVDTNPRARRLYERMGFRALRTRCYPFTGRWMGFSASTTMTREIKAGDI